MVSVSSDYPHPVTVNGYSCRNCSDVAKAEHNIDPAAPQGAKAWDREDAKARITHDRQRFDRDAVDRQADLATAHAAAVAAQQVTPVQRAYGLSAMETGSLVNLSG